MTQKDKDLVLKDLSARLPYGVMAKFGDSNPSKITNITQGIDSDSWFVESESEFDEMMCEINNVKPYLFPLSSMTEEQKNDCPISETNLNIINSNIGYGIIEMPWRLSYLFTDWCNKNHFDYLGLIPMGLANDATGLNIY